MANRHSNVSSLVPAAGYLRRSTEKQEKSLDDQRSEIERYAAQHGYSVVRWFEDDGISGDLTTKRKGFQAMHRAACNGRDFDVILVWDSDRFGRFNSIEGGYWIHPLVEAGVRLVTVTKGPVNWTDFTGRMMYAIEQEGKHQFLVDLSRNTARGQITTALAGHLCGQAAPYGYDRMYVDEHGQHRQRVHNGEEFAKPRSWYVTLVPSDDPEKVATAKWLFATYANTDVGLRKMADDLNTRKVPCPGDGRWSNKRAKPGTPAGLWWPATIREILRNEAYMGTFVWAKRRIGKYHRVAAGEIHTRTDGSKTKTNPVEERMVKTNAHEALITAATWKRVQTKLAARRLRSTSGRRTNGDAYMLSGMLYCAHCGRKMHGMKSTRRKGGKVYVYHKYICSTFHAIGTVNGCGHHAVDQAAILEFVCRVLREEVLAGGHKDTLRRLVKDRLEADAKADPAERKALQAKVADLDRDIETGTKRLLRAPDNIADLLAGELSKLRAQRDRLADDLERLTAASGKGKATSLDAKVEAMWRLANEISRAEPARVREVLRRMVERIDLSFARVPKGGRVFYPLASGTIAYRPDGEIYSRPVNRGDWI